MPRPAAAPWVEADRLVAFERYEIKSGGSAPRPWNGKSLLLAYAHIKEFSPSGGLREERPHDVDGGIDHSSGAARVCHRVSLTRKHVRGKEFEREHRYGD